MLSAQNEYMPLNISSCSVRYLPGLNHPPPTPGLKPRFPRDGNQGYLASFARKEAPSGAILSGTIFASASWGKCPTHQPAN